MLSRLRLVAQLAAAFVPLFAGGQSLAYEYIGYWQHARLSIHQLDATGEREYEWQAGDRPAVVEERLTDLLGQLYPTVPSSNLEVPLAFFLDHLGWSTWELVSVESKETAQGREALLWFRSGNNAPADGGDARATWRYGTFLVPSTAALDDGAWYRLQTGNPNLSYGADSAAELYSRLSGQANAPRLEPEKALQATFALLCEQGYQVEGSIRLEGLVGPETLFLLKREDGLRNLRDYEASPY